MSRRSRPGHRPARLRTGLVTAAVLAPLALAGCSGDDGEGEGGGEPSAGSSEAAEEGIVLSAASLSTEQCYPGEAPRDLAWFDVAFEAVDDLESVSVELVDADGVTAADDGVAVPATGQGGNLAPGQSAPWASRRSALDVRQLDVDGQEPLDGFAPAAGSRGVLVLHLVLDPAVAAEKGGASVGGVQATWTDADGATGTAEVTTEASWRAGGC